MSPTTPFDSFMRDVTAWLESAWYLGVVLILGVVLVVAAVMVYRARSRARARIPQYRRQVN